VKAEALRAAMKVDLAEWEEEIDSQGEWYAKLAKTLPRPLALQRELLLERVRTARKVR
jgi:phosphoenolpyruvate carboxykinase (GTP)